jgi:hypothetical protein
MKVGEKLKKSKYIVLPLLLFYQCASSQKCFYEYALKYDLKNLTNVSVDTLFLFRSSSCNYNNQNRNKPLPYVVKEYYGDDLFSSRLSNKVVVLSTILSSEEDVKYLLELEEEYYVQLLPLLKKESQSSYNKKFVNLSKEEKINLINQVEKPLLRYEILNANYIDEKQLHQVGFTLLKYFPVAFE